MNNYLRQLAKKCLKKTIYIVIFLTNCNPAIHNNHITVSEYF